MASRSSFVAPNYTPDEFMELFDLPPSQVQNAVRYKELKQKNKTQAEINELNELTVSLQNHLITPEKFNHFQDALTSMQWFIKDKVDDMLNQGIATAISELKRVIAISDEQASIFFVGDTITSFNKDTDPLAVYKNSVRLIEDFDYTVDTNNSSISKINGKWDGTVTPLTFEFIVMKNALNNLVFSDGSMIADGTVVLNKLSTDVQDKIKELANSVIIVSDVTIASASWVNDTEKSGYWYYDYLHTSITEDTVIDINIALASLEDASGIKSVTVSSAGSVRLYADAQPNVDIVADIVISKVVA